MSRPTPRTASEHGEHDGLVYELWLPPSPPPWPAVVIIHGAGSNRTRHADFARLASGSGWAAITYDQRGHGQSAGEFGPAAINDAARMAGLLSARDGVDPRRVCVRGSSLGGYVAIHAAATSPRVAGAIAICPAGEQHLLRGLRRGPLQMRADRPALEAWLSEHELEAAVELMGRKPFILLHARGDEQIPWRDSRDLYERSAEPRKLIITPNGHHRSVQHDAELQAVALRWLERALRR